MMNKNMLAVWHAKATSGFIYKCMHTKVEDCKLCVVYGPQAQVHATPRLHLITRKHKFTALKYGNLNNFKIFD